MREVTDSIADALPAAAAVFAEHGFVGTRMEDIVAATGVPRPTLYYHFEGKEQILAWLLERLLGDLSADVGTILDRDEPARDRLRSVIRAHFQLFADNPDLCAVLLTELGRITRIPQLADSIWAAFHEPVRKLLDAGEGDGSLRVVDGETAASAIFGTVTMVGMHYVVTGQPLDVPAVADTLDDLILNGLSPTSKGNGP